MIWTQGFVELFRWRKQRRVLAQQASTLVTETEEWLAARPAIRPPTEPPYPSEPPRAL